MLKIHMKEACVVVIIVTFSVKGVQYGCKVILFQ